MTNIFTEKQSNKWSMKVLFNKRSFWVSIICILIVFNIMPAFRKREITLYEKRTILHVFKKEVDVEIEFNDKEKILSVTTKYKDRKIFENIINYNFGNKSQIIDYIDENGVHNAIIDINADGIPDQKFVYNISGLKLQYFMDCEFKDVEFINEKATVDGFEVKYVDNQYEYINKN